MKLNATDPYIYKMFVASSKGGTGYVGQDSGTGKRPYNRILDHIETAYGLGETSQAGGSQLIKDYSISEICIHVFDSTDCFGVGLNNFIDFSQHGKSKNSVIRQQLTFAEMIGICAGMIDKDSEYNTWMGDKSYFTYDISAFINPILNKVYNNDTKLIQEIQKDLNVNLTEVVMHIPDSKENVEKGLNPEKYGLIRAFAKGLSYKLFRGQKGRDGLIRHVVIPIAKGTGTKDSIQKDLQNYINNGKSREAKIGNQYLPNDYQITSVNVRFDLSGEIQRMIDFIGGRINMTAYGMAGNVSQQMQADVIVKSVEAIKGNVPRFKNQQMSNNARSVFSIKRTAYVDNIKVSKSQFPQWYTNAITTAQQAVPTEKLHRDQAFLSLEKNISYKSCVNAICEAIPSCPLQTKTSPVQTQFLTLTGQRESNGALERSKLITQKEERIYSREDTLMSRTRQIFFRDKQMHILNENGNIYYRQCVSMGMTEQKHPLQEYTPPILEIEALSERPNMAGQHPLMIDVINQYSTHYYFKPYTGNGISINYGEKPDDLKYG